VEATQFVAVSAVARATDERKSSETIKANSALKAKSDRRELNRPERDGAAAKDEAGFADLEMIDSGDRVS
jgi:hypothetical protein